VVCENVYCVLQIDCERCVNSRCVLLYCRLTGRFVVNVFFHAFSSVVRQMPGYNSQRLGTANTLPDLLFVLFFFVIRVVLLLIVVFYVLFMCKCVLPQAAP
jgi:hypothetical protein